MQDPMLQFSMCLNNKNINTTNVIRDLMLQSPLCLKYIKKQKTKTK
jgi:hypothetical protein